jgi:hypothetical protein
VRRTVALGIAGLALLGSGGVSKPDARSAPMRLGATSSPSLGIVEWQTRGRLARIDPRSLRPLKGRRVPVPGSWSWAFSPDRSRVVLPVSKRGRTLPRTSLRFVDVRRLRAAGDLDLGAGDVRSLAWLSSDRLLVVHQVCCFGTFDVVVVAPRSRRILQRRTLEGEPVSVDSTRDELVVLVAPPQGIGPSRLLIVDEQGRERWVPLAQIWSGRHAPDQATDPVARHRYPGLAVDPEGRRAFVASADGSVASVDLQSLDLAYRTPTAPRSLLRRLWNWFEPAAGAKATDGPSRQALWLGSGLLAVTGSDDHTLVGSDGALSLRTEPAGLTLVDTGSWSARRIDDSISHVSRTGDLLLATGWRWDSFTQSQGTFGLAGYTLDGSKRFHLFEGTSLTQLRVYGSRAYVGLQGTARVGDTHIRLDDGSAFKIVDLASGEVIGTRTAPLPILLTEH